MEQHFLAQKADWISKMKWGDMAEAARIAGVTRATFQEWMQSTGLCRSSTDKRNLKALKQAIRAREKDLSAAMAA